MWHQYSWAEIMRQIADQTNACKDDSSRKNN